jgi:hypothetical protein
MNNIKKITGFSLVAGMFLIAALATSSPSNTGTAFAQNTSTAMNQTASQMNQTAAQDMSNQTAAQSANKTSTNQTSNKPDITTSDVEDIRKSLEQIRKDIADGKATEALKAINDMDNKLLVAMSKNPPPMLEKSTDNDND